LCFEVGAEVVARDVEAAELEALVAADGEAVGGEGEEGRVVELGDCMSLW
jgi:hypothetical protein